ncbi:ISAs1 family transposase [Nocardiopsis sp. N85]|uniref:ISAs1 family transposase n=1 Tax=Nocardiopsis sp. N85 TaxID=3029400 RepID=UPI00237FC181|nr:ISAs1 family transposase [Nocardiopsis sp. N85]MDE3724346.1 ISAs1 family transposase [Nocardiopsis sp. N85]
MLANLSPIDPHTIPDLRTYLRAIPDPRSLRGLWHPLDAILAICSCAAASGAKTIEEIAEWGQRAPLRLLTALGVRPHPLHYRRSPAACTIDRVLCRINAHALDAAIGAYLADRHHATTATGDDGDGATDNARPALPAIAVDGKALKGSARLDQPRRHLLSALAHHPPLTLAQSEVGAKTNETRHFLPLLQGLDLAGRVVTFDALHTVKEHLKRLVKGKGAHYVAMVKGNQPTLHAQISGLPWGRTPIAHTRSEKGHGRRESRSIKVMGIADSLGGICFSHARLVLRVHRRQQETGKKQTRETVFAVTSLDAHQATPADLAAYVRGHWAIENSSHHIRDVTFGEDACTVHTGSAPRAMAALRNLAIGVLKSAGADNIAKTTRAIRDLPEHALPFYGIGYEPDLSGT